MSFRYFGRYRAAIPSDDELLSKLVEFGDSTAKRDGHTKRPSFLEHKWKNAA
jgi:hypothetical protein